jgi:non-specific serine/threonine protein kinase
MAGLADLLGQSPPIADLRERIDRLIAGRPAGGRLPSILIEGETGTGKGLLARVLHGAGGRSARAFVDVNCAAIPETLLEAELFGFERGAFTDARQEKPGLFEAAHGGTLFLDEIALLPAGAQAKLLKAIEERVVRRLGSTRSRPVDVWLLCATNVPLADAARDGRFREDLYHRLAVVTLSMPPLRERGPDVVLLAEHFLARACADYGVAPKALTPEAAEVLRGHAWPGNVRELANLMARLAILSGEPRVTPAMLGLPGPRAGPAAAPASGDRRTAEAADSLRDELDAHERERLLQALGECDWNISQAAARLGLARGTLRYRIARHGLAPGAAGPSPARPGAPRRPEEPGGAPAVGSRATGAHGPGPARAHLPRQLSTFVGREREIAQVREALAASALVTLTGAGGVGKTRLALQVAAELAPAFRDGVRLVDLAPLGDPELVPQEVATALEVHEQAERPLAAVLVDHLRTRSLLLLLDNCEHLLPAAAALAEQLLRHCPDLRILATSREGLGVPGEALRAIPPLALPAPGTTVDHDELVRIEAVRLFAERVASVLPGFRVTERTAPAVVEICCRLDGIPLAIELAAARTKAIGVDEVAARLDDRFRLLTGGSRTALPRHQTLRGVLDWSHRLLTDGERVLFRRLSVFAGGFTLDAVERVGTGGPVARPAVADLLTRLVEQSLVVFDPGEGEPRYRLLETIRQYAQGALVESGEAEETRRAHLECYLDLAERAEAQLRAPGQTAWLARLGAEHENLRAALGWGVARPDCTSAALRLGAALRWYWYIRGPVHEGRHWLARALASPAEAAAPVRARALAGLGMMAWRANDFAQAREALEASLALARTLDDGPMQAFALHHLAHVEMMQVAGGAPRAAEMWEDSVNRFRKSGDAWGTAWSLRCLGDNLRVYGTTALAVARLEESLALLREVGDAWLIGHVLLSLGAIAREQGDHARAGALVEESLAIGSDVGDSYYVATVQRELGHVARARGDHARAATLYRASLAAFREHGDTYEAARVLEGLATLALARSLAEDAARLLGAAHALRVAIGAALRPSDAADHHPTVAKAREALGEARYLAAFAEGCGSPPEALVAAIPPEA